MVLGRYPWGPHKWYYKWPVSGLQHIKPNILCRLHPIQRLENPGWLSCQSKILKRLTHQLSARLEKFVQKYRHKFSVQSAEVKYNYHSISQGIVGALKFGLQTYAFCKSRRRWTDKSSLKKGLLAQIRLCGRGLCRKDAKLLRCRCSAGTGQGLEHEYYLQLCIFCREWCF